MTFKPYKPRPYASTKEVVTRAFDASGWCVKEIADFLGKSPTQTTAYSDPATDDNLTFDQACKLAKSRPDAAAVFAEHLASIASGSFVPVEVEPDCLEHIAAALSREFGEGLAALIEAAADPLRRHPAVKELDDLIRTAICARVVLTTQAPPTPPTADTDNVTTLHKRA